MGVHSERWHDWDFHNLFKTHQSQPNVKLKTMGPEADTFPLIYLTEKFVI